MYSLKYLQKLPLDLKQCWTFFSDPKNLKTITPNHLGFEIINDVDEKMYAGQIIEYKIAPVCNIPITWVTEITHVREPTYFVDEQRFGPYSFWHHEHHFIEIENGVEMIDLVYYKLPLGFIGKIIHELKVKNDLKEIFSYRKAILEKMFGVISH